MRCYSGKVVGWDERDQVLAFFRNLPLTRYTVLVCDFASWDETAPLPCFSAEKVAPPPQKQRKLLQTRPISDKIGTYALRRTPANMG